MALPLNHPSSTSSPLEKRRFGQENQIQQLISTFDLNVPNGSVGGPAIGTLLAAADPCKVVDVAEQVLSTGGTVNDARAVLGLEKNFNPFVVQAASICLDASKPTTADLRGILPLVDPSLPGAERINQLTQQRNKDIIAGTVNGAALAQGKSIADQMVELGFTAIQGINVDTPPPVNNNNANPVNNNAPPVNDNNDNDADANNDNNADANNDNNNNNAEISEIKQDLQALVKSVGDIEKKVLDLFNNNAASEQQQQQQPAAPAEQQQADAAPLQQPPSNNQGGAALGGIEAIPVVENKGADRPFSVKEFTFNNKEAAFQRSCDIQKNQCANEANSNRNAGFSVGDCEAQQQKCSASISSAVPTQGVGNNQNNAPNAGDNQNNTPAAGDTQNSTPSGACEGPGSSGIEFGFGLEGRKATEGTFRTKDLSHNTAKNPNIIFQFTCDRQRDRKDEKCIQKCLDATTAALAATPGEPQADAFNKIFLA
ncbi:hypothetical protein HDU92_005596 [Lobulomyces angularis]|nr:hypothetical protein HDU92_005596 [Lobulomyces angularis]